MTPSEFEKIKGAIECMEGQNIVNRGGRHVLQENVIYILSKFIETEEPEWYRETRRDLNHKREVEEKKNDPI